MFSLCQLLLAIELFRHHCELRSRSSGVDGDLHYTWRITAVAVNESSAEWMQKMLDNCLAHRRKGRILLVVWPRGRIGMSQGNQEGALLQKVLVFRPVNCSHFSAASSLQQCDRQVQVRAANSTRQQHANITAKYS
jgi:hypothetical protein